MVLKVRPGYFLKWDLNLPDTNYIETISEKNEDREPLCCSC
jgi:hypothetical protein